MNLFDNFGPMTTSPSEQRLKQVFKNNDISINSSLNKTENSTVINGFFYVSNNTDKPLNNVKLTFSVPKYITLKVLSTVGTNLDPMQSMGIKKVIKK